MRNLKKTTRCGTKKKTKRYEKHKENKGKMRSIKKKKRCGTKRKQRETKNKKETKWC